MFYLKKLLKKHKLVDYWLFFNGGFKCVFKVNLFFYSLGYNKGCLIDLFHIVDSLKKLVPFFFGISKLGGFFLFVASQFLYAKTAYTSNSTLLTKKITYRSPGILSNFAITCNTVFNKLDYKINPSGVIFFSSIKTNYLLEETKIKNIPTIALLTGDTNSNLVDYPICINSIYFHSIYFFISFFFKLVLFGK